MDLAGWNKRYREQRSEDLDAPPTPLLVATASPLAPGRALDLASGVGRNAIWLAEHGWKVTAIEGASAAAATLSARSRERDLEIDVQCVSLPDGLHLIPPASFDLVVICYYLQRDLFEPAKAKVNRHGTLLAIVHTTRDGEEPNAHRLRPGELANYFADWTTVYYYEGEPADPAHKRSVAEIVCTRP